MPNPPPPGRPGPQQERVSAGAAKLSGDVQTGGGVRSAGRTAGKRATGGGRTKAASARRSRLSVIPAKPRLPRSGKTVLDGLGVPVYGARQGSVEQVDWNPLHEDLRRNPLWSFLRHRKGVYATAATDQLHVAIGIVDGGVFATAFCVVTDLTTGQDIIASARPGGLRPLVDVGDHPTEGLSAKYRLPGTDYQIQRDPGSSETRISVRMRRTGQSLPGLRWLPGLARVPVARRLPTASTLPWLDLELTLEPTVAPALTAIRGSKGAGAFVSATVKTAAMNTWGTITIHGDDPLAAPHTLSLDGGTGSIHYTNGYLPRRTSWLGAATTGRLRDGRLFGLSLVSDFCGLGDDTTGNAVWLDGALVPVDSPVRVLFDARDHTGPWTVRTLDGSIHLQFEPLTVHDDRIDLGVIRGRSVAPTGLFSGHVTVEGEQVAVHRMPGTVQRQDIRW